MDIQKLRYFLSVAKNQSLTEAAVELGVTQSAISQQISDLERQLGAQLIIRNKRPFQLTWVGKTLVQEAHTLITLFDRASERIQLASSGKQGYLNIGFLQGMEYRILPQMIKEFRNFYPHIFTSLQQYTWTEINGALLREEIDIGFTLSHRIDEYPDLKGRSVSCGCLCVAVHRNHPLASKKVINLADLSKEPFVMFADEVDPLLNELTLKTCAEYGFFPKVVSRNRDLSALLVMVETGVGIMLVPGFISDNDRTEICIIELGKPHICLDVIIAINHNNSNPAVPIFVEQISNNKIPRLREQRVEALRPGQSWKKMVGYEEIKKSRLQ